ncbi:MAG: CRISPR-associated endonuclease Cas3'', partial [Clostridiales bacterium]|nr:CRISPR-associated endonuclease Cas3'' [Clostridiales bacterium]
MFAAHIRKNKYGEVEEEQSVREHCSGVMALAGQFGETLGASDIIKCAALIHDLGKLTVDFNGYIHGINNFARGQIDHCFAGAKFINEYARKYDKHQYYDTAMLIARIVISHHKLHDWVNDNCENYFEQRIGKSDRYVEILKNKENVFSEEYIDDLFEKAVREYERLHERILEISERDRRKYCFYMGMLERLLQSMLVDADRIDTAEFMENKRIRLDYDMNVVRNEMYNNIEKISAEFRTLTDRIAVYRMSISDRCAGFAGKKRGICRLVVPTGGGKTISSMRFAIHYCKQFNMDRIIYVAPFMSILEQNAKIIKSMVGDETLFLEFHSNIISRINNDEELHKYEMRTDLWDCPVIATTMVQFLNTLLSDEMTCVRRMHRLSKSVIIIDEVQSIPIKCVNLFKLSVNFLQKICGCTIVLCSATQPTFADGKYGIRFDCEESMTGDFTEDFKNFKRTEIIPALRREQYSFEEAAE